MKLPVVLAAVLGIALLIAAIGCSTTPPLAVEPTPNIDAMVEARAKELVAAQATSAPTSTNTQIPPPTYTPQPDHTNTPTVVSTGASVPTPAPRPLPTAVPTPEATPTPTAVPTVTPLPAPTPDPRGGRVTYFDNAVYYLPPVTESMAAQYLDSLERREVIEQPTKKQYQLRQVDGVYEIRHGLYLKEEQRYYKPDELQNWLSDYEESFTWQSRVAESACARQEDDFDGVNTVGVIVANPMAGFDDVVLRVPCTTIPPVIPFASLWIGDLLDEAAANEILARQTYKDKWISVTGHTSHVGDAQGWLRFGYEIEIEDVGDYRLKSSGYVYCYPQASQESLLTKLVTGDRITVMGIVEELEGLYSGTVRLKSCLIDDITFNPEPIDPSCVSLQGSYEDSYGYLIVEFTAQNNCGVAVWFVVAGSATFITNQPWSFTVSDYSGDYFVLGPDDILVEENMVEKPDWADGSPGEIYAVDLDISLASITGLP